MDLHAGILDLETSGLVGPYAYAVNVAETGAVTAADATRPRVDIVWVRLDDPAESDGSSVPAVVAGYTAGAPLAGTPVAPATPARCMVLATIQVPMSGGGSPTVIWVAPYTVAAGAPTPVWSQAERDALTVYNGLQVYRLDLHVVETYNGTAWTGAPQAFTPVYAATGGANSGYTGTGRYIQTGKQVTYWFQIAMGTITSSAGISSISLPVPASMALAVSSGSVRLYDSSTVNAHPAVRVALSSASTLAMQVSTTYGGPLSNVAFNVPWAWATGDIIDGFITYEAA